MLGGNVFYGSAEIASGTDFANIPLGISYYANPQTASDAPLNIVQQDTNHCQSIVIKRGNSPTTSRGLMVVINKLGVAVKFKGANWDANWTYLITIQ